MQHFLPSNADDAADCACVKFYSGDRRGGLADISRAIELYPNDPDLVARRGRMKLKSGDSSGAVADFKR